MGDWESEGNCIPTEVGSDGVPCGEGKQRYRRSARTQARNNGIPCNMMRKTRETKCESGIECKGNLHSLYDLQNLTELTLFLLLTDPVILTQMKESPSYEVSTTTTTVGINHL